MQREIRFMSLVVFLATSLALSGTDVLVRAQDDDEGFFTVPTVTVTASTTSTAVAPKKDDKDIPKPIKEVVPDAQKIDGMITLYRKKDKLYAEIAGNNLNTDYLIAMAIAKGTGRKAIGGFTLGEGDDWLWQFRKVNDKIQVVRRNIRFKADGGTPEAKSVEIAYSDSILYSLSIVAKGEKGGDVIDLDSIFMADLPKIGGRMGGSFARDRSMWGSVKGFENNIELEVAATYSTGGFGRFMVSYDDGSSPDSSSTGVTLHYSISKLPSSGYSPRLADPRVGFFTSSHKNYSKNQKDNHMVRYINRWNVQKAEFGDKPSPPKKPIVFWIEKTVPFKYRNAVREGILEWNKAFEKVGIVGAIEVRQQADNDTWDSEDINYNTFRWITSSAGFAMGPSHANPMTGEILDADIIMDAGFVDSWKKEFDIFLGEAMPVLLKGKSKAEQVRTLLDVKNRVDKEHAEEHAKEQEIHEGMNQSQCSCTRRMAGQIAFASLAAALLAEEDQAVEEKKDEKKEDEKKDDGKKDEKKPEEKKDEKKPEEKKDEKKPEEKKDEKKPEEKKDEKKPEEKKDEKKDDDAKKKEEEAKKEAEKKKKEEEERQKKEELKKKSEELFEKFLLAGIKDVVMHEVGHTLGLRHNFKASSWLTLKEINDPKRSKEFGFAGSVMDYLPVNIMPKGQPQGDFFMATLGPYDYLAIEYGYKSLSGGTDGEKTELKKIAAKQSQKGNRYAPDEDVWVSYADPSTDMGDIGSDPIDFAKANKELYKQLLPKLLDKAAKEGDSYRDVGFYFRVLFFNTLFSNDYVARNVGGLYLNRDFRGDPDGKPPVVVVPAKTQRESLEYVCANVFAVDAFKIPSELYNQFGSEKWLDWNWNIQQTYDFELRDMIVMGQSYILRTLVNPETLSRLDDTELRVKDGDDVFTVAELFDKLTPAIFKELSSLKEGDFSPKKPAITLLRRNLQEYYFLMLAEYAGGNFGYWYNLPESCQSIPKQQLIGLSTEIEAVLKGKAKLDSASKAHLVNLNERVKKVLNSQLQQRNP